MKRPYTLIALAATAAFVAGWFWMSAVMGQSPTHATEKSATF